MPLVAPNDQASLTQSEFKSLRIVVKGGVIRRKIPEDHKAKLMEAGYVKQGLGGLAPTDAGLVRVAQGK